MFIQSELTDTSLRQVFNSIVMFFSSDILTHGCNEELTMFIIEVECS